MKPSKENEQREVKPTRSRTVLEASKGTSKPVVKSDLVRGKMLKVNNAKRPASSPKTKDEPMKKKRPAIGDITNAIQQCSFQAKKKPVKKESFKEVAQVKVLNKRNKAKAKKATKQNLGNDNKAFVPLGAESIENDEFSKDSIELGLVDVIMERAVDGLDSSNSDLSMVTSSQESSESSEDQSTNQERTEQPDSGSAEENKKPADVRDIDQDEDPCNVCEYAQSVFKHMKANEANFKVRKYLGAGSTITPQMRAILIDWLVEIQENFELYHETLYLAVNIVDLYLQDNPCSKDNLQLVGATALFISCKVEERYAPPLDDFVYICDDIYNGDNFRQMEKTMLKSLDFRLNVPSSYRFLRRYGRIASVSMEVLTLSRYILESSLTEYDFVDCSASMMAAAALNLALKMKNCGEWDSTLHYYTDYSGEDLKPLTMRLNNMVKAPPKSNVMNVRKKYSHPVFYEVAKTEPLNEV